MGITAVLCPGDAFSDDQSKTGIRGHLGARGVGQEAAVWNRDRKLGVFNRSFFHLASPVISTEPASAGDTERQNKLIDHLTHCLEEVSFLEGVFSPADA